MRYGISDEVNENMVQCEKAHNVKAVIRLEVAGFQTCEVMLRSLSLRI